MIRFNYNMVPADKRAFLENRQTSNIMSAFDETVNATWEWLQSDEAKKFFFQQQGRLSQFMRESGINDEWDTIIERRANKGADIATEIYEYARNMNIGEDVLRYTPQERMVLNRLCDSNYELIKNVCNDEVKAIRQRLLSDYANGDNPRQTSLKEIQLEPINGWSPEQRAVVIARTETAREINTATLQQYTRDGIEFVTLLCSSDCEECLQYAEDENGNEKLVPISEAMEAPCIHPNCRCAWVPAEGQMIQ